VTENFQRRKEAHARAIARTLRAAGHVALFAGGCVRDVLLGRTPKDSDIATNATPDEVAKLFSAHHRNRRAFGVMQVVMDGHPTEVATFRRDLGSSDGAGPMPSRQHAGKDAQRRDFTVNGLFQDPKPGQSLIT